MVERHRSIIESNFQYEKYLSDLEEIILTIFNQDNYADQPKYIAEMGCGDGKFLEKIYAIIANKSLRGKVLNEYPIKLIGIDFNEKALEETDNTLKDIEHIVLKGDIGNPEKMIVDLKTNGIEDVENILHLRSFMDHERPYIPPVDTAAENARPNIPCEAVYVDRDGNILPSQSVTQSLIEHLKRWSVVTDRGGLIVLDAHYIAPKIATEFMDKWQNLHFAPCPSFSQQLLVEADKFLIAAAETGLFPKQDAFKKYPQTLPFTQITLTHFEQREYRIRYAQERDLPALERLEKRCWEPGLRRPVAVLAQRLKQYPEGQLVLELDNKVVGAIYSQRLLNPDDLKISSFENVERLNTREGAFVQLVAVNVLPELQHKNLGDQLLEFMLQLSSVMNGIHKIVAVTKCKDYPKHTYVTPEKYIRLRNKQGRLVDTILRFHELHGGQIKELIPNYRPPDTKNHGYGVLVEYDVYNRHRNNIQISSSNSVAKARIDNVKDIKDFVIKTIISILGTTEEASFSLDQPLMEMGLDSGDLLELNEQISYKYQIRLNPAFFFKYNTSERIIAYLQEHIDLGKDEDVIQNEEAFVIEESDQEDGRAINQIETQYTSPQKKDIAVVGVACRLPGGIRKKEQLWELLAGGKAAISRKPLQRWNWPNNIDPDNDHKGIDLGGFLDEIDKFDAGFFRISPKEAELIDPQQRILLELSWECLEDAGYSAKAVSGSKTGVFIGASGSDYNRLLDKQLEQIDAYYGIGTSMAVLPNRISYFYDFHGPSIQIDTACSSSLVAIHEAVKSLQTGECEQAIVGGINVMCHPFTSIAYYKAGMLAKDGRCKTFDKEANGYVRGEGAVMMLLKPLEQALCDQDSILGVIKGTAINHGGQASGLTVPNPAKQAGLLIEAYRTAEFEPETISYIEVHGTGTSLGDPIEISGLKEAFSQLSATKEEIQEPYCGLGSIKTNIGHLEAAAGIAGLLKVMLGMRQHTIPASLNYNELNPHISLDKSPFYIVNKNQPWKVSVGQSVRRAGVSSFGSGGANAHVVLEEAPSVTRQDNPKFPYYIICLSAKTQEALQQKEQDLAYYLEKEGWKNDLADISATLLLGREHFSVRSAYVIRDVQELQRKLKEVSEKGQAEGYFRERNAKKRNQQQLIFEELGQKVLQELQVRENIHEQEYSNKLIVLAELYAKGCDLDWNVMFANSKMFRINLPTYPFAKERYWVPEMDATAASSSAAVTAVAAFIHPLLQQNTSDFSEQRFSSTFTGQEFFLVDHVVKGQRVLPGMSYLEMVRAAVEQAVGVLKEGQRNIRLKNVVWSQPILVGEQPVQVHIGLFPEDNGEIGYEIYRQPEGTDAKPVVHSQGRAMLSSIIEVPALNLKDLQAECWSDSLSSSQCYEAFKTIGLEYSQDRQGIEQVHVGAGQLLVKLTLPSSVANTQGQFVLHPCLLDSVLMASLMINCDGYKKAIPFTLQELEIISNCTSTMWALIRHSGDNKADDKVQKLDIDLCNEKGKICVRMKGLILRVLADKVDSLEITAEPGNMMLQPDWKEQAIVPITTESEYAQHLVILCEQGQIAQESIEKLIGGARCLTMQSEQKRIEERFPSYAVQAFEEIQSILKGKPKGKVLIQIVVPNQGEQQVFAGLAGLLKTVQLEEPKVIGQIIQVEHGETSEEIVGKLKKNSQSPIDKQIRYENGKRWVAGWSEIQNAQKTEKIPWKDRGVYLITGGAGGLGCIFAQEIVQKAKNITLILTGRSALNEKKQAQLKELAELGAQIEYKQVDVTDKKAITSLIQSIQENFGNLQGIIHSAGVIRDNFIFKKTKEEFIDVLAPKVIGLITLDQATKALPLDFFILFSSTSGSLGNPGQADYSTANTFMDAYAKYRNELVLSKQRHGQTLSINWPLWKDGGMHADEETEKVMMQTTGMIAMQTSTGIKALYQGLASGKDQLMVMEGDLIKIRKYLLEPSAKPHFDLNTPLPVDTELLREKTIYHLKLLVGETIKLGSGKIDSNEPLESYGIDSIIITQLNQKLACIFGELSKTLFFEYQTLGDLAEYFITDYPQECSKWTGLVEQVPSIPKMPMMESLAGRNFGDEVPLLTSRKTNKRLARNVIAVAQGNKTREPIAIIGMSGRYPQAKNVKEYWGILKAGQNCVTEIPPGRWSIEGFYHPDRQEAVAQGKSYSKWGGFVEGFADFDPLFFNISPREAINMDPQERLFVEACWEVIEDAGYTREQLALQHNRRVGVFAGITKTGFNLYGPDLWKQGEKTLPRTSFGSVANRISYLLNLQGPSMPIDTMCSSSLTAIHEACEHLHQGECEMAIAGGVNLYLHPACYVELCSMQMLSTNGQCKSFGHGGNGFVPGEGVGCILLKPLSRAIADGDHIDAVIRGTSINHGGKTNGYTVPSPTAQGDLIRDALDKAGINARTVSYIEAHGTGTELGDPIEITGLTQAFQKDTKETGFCAIGSVKSNIGHLEAAAGIAGITKIVLQMKNKQIVPSLHAKELNGNINFGKTPFVVQQELGEWKRPVVAINGESRECPLIAGISSFGAGGSNAHVVMEEYIAPREERTLPTINHQNPAIVVLSAKTQESLKEQAGQLLTAIQEQQFLDTGLGDIAYTLQIGREAMEERLAIIVSSIKELEEKLQGFIEGKESTQDLYRGQVKQNKETLAVFAADEELSEAIDKWIQRRKYAKLVDLWTKGLNFDWNKLYGDSKPSRISLPTYPFARERYWILGTENASESTFLSLPSDFQLDDIFFDQLIDKIRSNKISIDDAVQKIENVSK